MNCAPTAWWYWSSPHPQVRRGAIHSALARAAAMCRPGIRL
ncbi:MAG TPA: hypothetical protein VKU38_06230 [Ktedonobacteraceae bacterium]|nr:hypothetical protein [Ktedonobacteraceae bacterium]